MVLNPVIHQPKSGYASDGQPTPCRDEEDDDVDNVFNWTSAMTLLLLETYREHAAKFQNPKKKKKAVLYGRKLWLLSITVDINARGRWRREF